MPNDEPTIGVGGTWDRVTVHRPDVTVAIDLAVAKAETRFFTFRTSWPRCLGERTFCNRYELTLRGMETEAMLGRQPWPDPMGVCCAVFAQFERAIRCS